MKSSFWHRDSPVIGRFKRISCYPDQAEPDNQVGQKDIMEFILTCVAEMVAEMGWPVNAFLATQMDDTIQVKFNGNKIRYLIFLIRDTDTYLISHLITKL